MGKKASPKETQKVKKTDKKAAKAKAKANAKKSSKESKLEEDEEEEPNKKPKNEGSILKLTKKNLEKLTAEELKKKAPDMNEEEWTMAVTTMPKKEAMKLWKQFEQDRKSKNKEQEYSENTGSGTGMVARKRKMLWGWLLDGCKFAKYYRESFDEISRAHSKNTTARWLTKQEAIATWGEAELKQRLHSQTIKYRRTPEDKRFFEFRKLTEAEEWEVKRRKATSYSGQGEVSKEMMLEWGQMDLDEVQDADFNAEPSSSSKGIEDTEEKDLMKFLGIKEKKKDKPLPKGEKESPWDKLSKIEKADSEEQVREKVQKFKAELTKDEVDIESKIFQVKKVAKNTTDHGIKKHFNGLLKTATKTKEKLSAMVKETSAILKQPKMKMETVKNILMKDAAALKEGKTLKLTFTKELNAVAKAAASKKKAQPEAEEEEQGQEEEAEEEEDEEEEE